MPYVGGSVTSFFGEAARQITATATRDMCQLGGATILRFAAANTPVRTGRLRASWRHSDAKPAFESEGVGYRSEVHTDVDYAPYVENGTGVYGPKHAPYVIRPKSPGGVLRWVGKDGQVVFARYVVHPGSPGNHMMGIALNVVEGLAQDGAMFDPILLRWAREIEAQAEKQA